MLLSTNENVVVSLLSPVIKSLNFRLFSWTIILNLTHTVHWHKLFYNLPLQDNTVVGVGSGSTIVYAVTRLGM